MDSVGFPEPLCTYPFCKGQLTIRLQTLVSHRCNGDVEGDSKADKCFSLRERLVRDRMKTTVAVISHTCDTCSCRGCLWT